MKKIILFTVLLVSFKGLAAQSVFYDAVVLKKQGRLDSKSVFEININAGNYNECVKALTPYLSVYRQKTVDSLIQVANGSDSSQIQNIITDIVAELEQELNGKNPYISIKSTVQSNKIGISALNKIGANGVINTLGGLDVTDFANAMADFLVKRTKEELNVAFFSKLRKEMEKPEYKDLRMLFPTTYSTLSVIGDEIYNYTPYLNLLRQSFEQDLQDLLPNIQQLWEEDRYKKIFRTMPELEMVFKTAVLFSEGIINNDHPGDVINELAQTDFVSEDQKVLNFKNGIVLFNLFSQSFRSTNDKNYWIKADSARLLLQNEVLLRIYLGLIYQKAPDNLNFYAEGADPINFKSKLKQAKEAGTIDSLKRYVQFAQNIASHGNRIDKLLKEMENDTVNYITYHKFFDAVNQLFEQMTQIEKLPYIRFSLPDYCHTFIYSSKLTNYICLDVNRRNYPSAIMNAVLLLDTVYHSLNLNKEDSAKLKVNTDKFLQYGMLAANIAMAESAEEMERAIEAIALPSGSSRIKRESRFNVALNAYTGLFGGYERIQGESGSISLNSYGVSAPIGLSVNWGKYKAPVFLNRNNRRTGHCSNSIFISLVDIGALAAFRFAEDSVSAAPNIQLKDIVSPGIFYSFGFPRSPLSVNVGYQVGPVLRKITATDPGIGNSYSRFSVALVVDIPLLNFHNKK